MVCFSSGGLLLLALELRSRTSGDFWRCDFILLVVLFCRFTGGFIDSFVVSDCPVLYVNKCTESIGSGFRVAVSYWLTRSG